MLSAYVQDNHRDWGAQISFVMMAYMLARKKPKNCPKITLLPGKPEDITKFSFKSTDTKGTQTASCESRILKKRKIHRNVSSYVQDNKKIEEILNIDIL